jgi:hypothetical protein
VRIILVQYSVARAGRLAITKEIVVINVNFDTKVFCNINDALGFGGRARIDCAWHQLHVHRCKRLLLLYADIEPALQTELLRTLRTEI